jgi:hypothetical protein
LGINRRGECQGDKEYRRQCRGKKSFAIAGDVLCGHCDSPCWGVNVKLVKCFAMMFFVKIFAELCKICCFFTELTGKNLKSWEFSRKNFPEYIYIFLTQI